MREYKNKLTGRKDSMKLLDSTDGIVNNIGVINENSEYLLMLIKILSARGVLPIIHEETQLFKTGIKNLYYSFSISQQDIFYDGIICLFEDNKLVNIYNLKDFNHVKDQRGVQINDVWLSINSMEHRVLDLQKSEFKIKSIFFQI